MRKTVTIICILALCLLAGCKSQPDGIYLDSLRCDIPTSYTAVTVKDLGAEQIFQNQESYICTFKESKQQLIDDIRQNGIACEFISLESYVQTYCETEQLDAEILDEKDIWYLFDTEAIGETEYTYMCIFYETEENFWRVYGCFPTSQWETDSQDLWEILITFA